MPDQANNKDANIPQVISHYRVIEKLSDGGMGVVYKAEDTKLGRFVALKFLPTQLAGDHAAVERFQREARAASALNHPNICTVYDIEECDGRTFIAMELLEGATLQKVVKGRRIKTEFLVRLAIQIAEGLNAAHAKGIIHRDIKPTNVFLIRGDHIKILDFGLAKLRSESEGERRAGEAETCDLDLTEPGMAVGTVAYMSPEQARGGVLDARTDLFSLGALLYEMATGRPAFSGKTRADILAAVLAGRPLPISTFNPDLRPDLNEIIIKLLEKDREVRYQHASDLAADLKRLKRDLDSGVSQAAQQYVRPSDNDIRKKIARDLVKTFCFVLILLVINNQIDSRPFGKDLRQFQLALAQDMLRRGPIAEDLEAGGLLLPVVVDISAIHPVKRQPTERKTLDAIVDELHRAGAKAIGIDISFDDLTGSDFQYLDKWTGYGNVRVGVHLKALEKREAWLGRPEFAGLAAGIALPKRDPQKGYPYIRRLYLQGAGTSQPRENLRDCKDGDYSRPCKQDLAQMPVAMWLLSHAAEDAAEASQIEQKLKSSLGNPNRQLTKLVGIDGLALGEYAIDYGYLKEIQKDKIILTAENPEETPVLKDQLNFCIRINRRS